MIHLIKSGNDYVLNVIPRNFEDWKAGTQNAIKHYIDFREDGSNIEEIVVNLSVGGGGVLVNNNSITLIMTDEVLADPERIKENSIYSFSLRENAGALLFRGKFVYVGAYDDEVKSSINTNIDGSINFKENSSSDTEFIMIE